MAKNIAEINAQNEQFLNSIIGEMTADGQEVVGEQAHENEEFEDAQFKLETILTNGETLVMCYSESDMDELMSQLPGLEAMIVYLKGLLTQVYEKGYSQEIETALDSDLSSFDLPIDYEQQFPRHSEESNEDTLRLVFKITDAVNIWTTVTHALKEKQLMVNMFKLFAVQDTDKETKEVD